jgi:hypothetical protein
MSTVTFNTDAKDSGSDGKTTSAAAVWQKKHTIQWSFKRSESANAQPLPESDSNTLSFIEFSQVIGLHPLVALFFNLDDCNKAQVPQSATSLHSSQSATAGHGSTSSPGGSPGIISSPVIGTSGRETSSQSVSAQSNPAAQQTGQSTNSSSSSSANNSSSGLARSNSLANLPSAQSDASSAPVSGSVYLSRQFQMLN